MRLFLAVDLPRPVKDEVGSMQQRLRRAGADVRWVAPTNAHFTVKFLGEVSPPDLPEIETAVRPAAARCASASIEIRGVGAFPNPRRPRVVWAGIVDADDRLRRLHEAVDEALGEIGFARERRAFRPHVTLGRVRGKRRLGALRRALEEAANVELGALTVRELLLFESHLSPRGPRYEPLSIFPLVSSTRSAG